LGIERGVISHKSQPYPPSHSSWGNRPHHGVLSFHELRNDGEADVREG
jgi:hypothetical protein